MASMLDSFKETYFDKFAFFKLLVFAIPLYWFWDQYLKGTAAFSSVLNYIYITAFFLFGFFIQVTNSVLNEKDWVMPTLNPFKLAFSSLKGIVAILPSAFVCIWAANYITGLINVVPWFDNTFKTIIWLIASAIILTSFLMFVKNENILDAFNLSTLGKKSGDFILGIIFYALQLVLMNIPTYGFVGYAINILFGVGPLLYFFIAYAIVFNLVATGHYMAQLQYEILGYDKQQDPLPTSR